MTTQCQNLSADRKIGDYWERQFCKLAASQGRSFTPHQIGRPTSAQAAFSDGGKYHTATLPDITLWTRPGEHHEIKHKDQTKDGKFGLERYRVDALRWFAEETGQSVYYTIHCYDFVQLPTRKERKHCRENNASHWITASIMDLLMLEYETIASGPRAVSWVAGERKENVEICYWPSSGFFLLTDVWKFVSREAKEKNAAKNIDRRYVPDDAFGGLF